MLNFDILITAAATLELNGSNESLKYVDDFNLTIDCTLTVFQSLCRTDVIFPPLLILPTRGGCFITFT